MTYNRLKAFEDTDHVVNRLDSKGKKKIHRTFNQPFSTAERTPVPQHSKNLRPNSLERCPYQNTSLDVLTIKSSNFVNFTITSFISTPTSMYQNCSILNPPPLSSSPSPFSFTPKNFLPSFFHLLLLLLLMTNPCAGQLPTSQRPFPPLFNAALGRPVSTNPSASTCGLGGTRAFCISSTQVQSINTCLQDFCVQTCPGRTALPEVTKLLEATSPGSGDCVVADIVNTRPGSSAGDFSWSLTRAGPTCFLQPRASPRLDTSGAVSFTLTVWVWLDSQDMGTVLEKLSFSGDSLFSFQVGTSGVRLVYGYTADSAPLVFSADLNIPQANWTHITLQVHDVAASIYINGPDEDLAPTVTRTLLRPVSDGTGSYRVGQSGSSGNQFIGRLQDLNFYALAVSNREIAELYSGVFPSVRIQSSCRCQSTYPRIKPGDTTFCIKNGAVPTTTDSAPRLSRNAHPLEYLNDGNSNTRWISSYLNEVEIEVDLGDEFQVFYVLLQFYSPQPKAVTIYRQAEVDGDWEPWQFYADDCQGRFSMVNNGAFSSPFDVNCLQFGTNGAIIPYSQGSITFNLLAPDPVARPGSNDFYTSPELHEFVKARKVKVKFQDHYYVTTILHQYYAVYEFIVQAWCDCNGHASACDTSKLPYTCDCLPSSNTQGLRCDICKPLFNNKPFRKGDNRLDNACQPCICNGHAQSCVYNATLDPVPESHTEGGGGICVNCQHNTEGRFCETCAAEYFRPLGVSLSDPEVCQPCACSVAGTIGEATDCLKVGGQCPCKANVEGRACERCKIGFYLLTETNPDGCLPCSCNILGVKQGDMSCNQLTGQCNCKDNVQGIRCDECKNAFFSLTSANPEGCTACNCNPVGSTSMFCNPNDGQCLCKPRVQGVKCDECKDGFFNFTNGCDTCQCDPRGKEDGTVCDKASGKCTCKRNTEGLYCERCRDGTYSFGSSPVLGCIDCPCNAAGTINGTGACDPDTGDCFCKENVEGQGCDRCKPNTFGLDAADPLGCKSCGCDPTGTQLEGVPVCDQNTGNCSCLANRQGRRCDSCIQGFYFNPNGGCLACSCHPTGTLFGTFCDTVTGDCECRAGEFGVSGKSCDRCLPTFYKFDPRLGVCTACNCLPAGSVNDTCHAISGQCECKELVTGRACDTCVDGSSGLDPNNPFGCNTFPSQQPPPEFTARTSSSISLRWDIPDNPNGVLLSYNVYRGDTIVGTVSANVTTFVDIGLQPYTQYSYSVEASNAHGSTRSTPVVFETLAGTPTNDAVLTVTDVRARSAFCSWTAPSSLNGPLLNYAILSRKNTENSTVTEWEGQESSTTLTTLSPYTRYTLIVRTCTVGGCTDNTGVDVVTMSAPPEGQRPPTVTAVNSASLLVQWEPPLKPNGIISFYELWFRGAPNAEGVSNPVAVRVFHPSGRYDPLTAASDTPLAWPQTNFTQTGLEAFTEYQFQVLAENDAGKTESLWASGVTKEAVPKRVPPPTVTGVSSTELSITWVTPLPQDILGVVQTYRIFYNAPTDPAADPFGPAYIWRMIYQGDGTVFQHSVPALTPYSEHTFILEACNGVGCTNSTAVTGRTLVDAPEGVQAPKAEGFNTTAMKIAWNEPLFPNGPSPSYRVEKTNIALSYPASVVRGTRFTGGGYYQFKPDVIPQGVAFTGIRFRFRLESGTGILLFSASSSQEEFVAVQFINGRPRFLFDTQGTGRCTASSSIDYDSYTNWTTLIQSGFHTLEIRRNGNNGYILIDDYFRGCRSIAFVTTTNDEGLVYNDKKWHSFEARRSGIYGKVTVDEVWTGESYIRDPSCQDTSIIGPTEAVYVGGFPPDFVLRRADGNRRVETAALQGCIDSIEIMMQMYPDPVWKKLDLAEGVTNDLAFLNWQGCPVNLQAGFHFMGKGYLAIQNCNQRSCDIRGNEINVSFRMRTTLHTGLLFLFYGGSSVYMYSYMVNGRLVFVLSDITTRTILEYSDPAVNLCDGQIRAMTFHKLGQQARIMIAGNQVKAVGDPGVPMVLSLTSYLHIGGIKPGSEAAQYVQENGLLIPGEGFGGCISRLEINGNQYWDDMTVVEIANTNLDGCPPFYTPAPEDTCQSSLITEVYSGSDRVAFDTGLMPYTDYIYRVAALNEAGEGYSSWSYGRTKEGAPRGVGAPTEVRSISGHEIEVTWKEPEMTYGLITKYVVVAYVIGAEGNDSLVSQDVFEVTRTAINMTTVVPDTLYLVKIKACTPGGCTESEDGVQIKTPIEAPEDVQAPTAESGPTYLVVRWELPGKPNGPITGFFLYQDGVEIYTGGRLNYNVTGLQVYTAYNFRVSACTVAGCTEGPSIAISTAQLPPRAVDPPVLLVLGISSIQASWTQPSHLNGVLKSYLLYAKPLSSGSSEPPSSPTTVDGEPVYNSTVLITNTIIENLLAGTTYNISLGACTEGGCTVSAPATATTEESAPQGVPEPVVISTSPSMLQVSWDPPEFPNGHIINYILLQNGAEVYNGLVRQYAVDGLAPYSRHTFRVRACTVKGCAASNEVVARTLETAPQGNIVLSADVEDSRTINVLWTTPENLNGFMTYYVLVTGLFYADVEAWDYSTVTEQRVLLNETVGFTEYQIGPLVPMSSYTLQINGTNSMGFILSNAVQLDMPPGTPDGMAPPELVSATSRSVTATWRPVGRVNADEDPAYTLQFKNSESADAQDEFGPTVTLSYTKTTNILPYTEYFFRVIVRNSYGQTVSDWASVVTLEDKPGSMSIPLVAGVRARYVDLTWSPPLSPNGVLTSFKIYANSELKTQVLGNTTTARVDHLTPYTFYTFEIEACTHVGCTRGGPSSNVRTLEDVPTGLQAPTLTAMSPSAIQVVYAEPGQANGQITEYIIERREGQETNNASVVVIRPPEMIKTYNDESNELTPFTEYSYRVNVRNGAGLSVGPWAVISTAASRPAGIMPPEVTSLDPTSVLVIWSPPLQPNGLVESYVLRFPNPRLQFSPSNGTRKVVEGLTPYTDYAVTVTACTNGGCTESTPTRFRTESTRPAPPPAPSPTAVSSSRISVLWQESPSVNGPGVRYELSRLKFKQPLDTTAADINTWQSVYQGNDRFFEDTNLPMFTTYIYRVTVFNDVGQAVSPNSSQVTTFGGLPRLPAVVSADPIDHLSVRVNWTLPSPVELQGDVQTLTLAGQSSQQNVTAYPSPLENSYVLGSRTSLTPNTKYEVTLEITIFGGASITSEPVMVKTLSGAPNGLPPPVLFAVSTSELRVSWSAPSQPNGDIISYAIIIGDRRVNPQLVVPGSFVVGGLQPYTVYDVVMEACTVFSCTTSAPSQGATAEAPPQGQAAPVLFASSPTQLQVAWASPDRPNGVIQRYDLWRKTLQKCVDIPPPTTDPELEKCTYIECGILENRCGRECYTGSKVCCEGTLHDAQPDYGCCGTHYIAKGSEDIVCCAGKFYIPQENYQCCGNRYIHVPDGEICCPDPSEDRVSVSRGDACCGGMPYVSGGAQICCQSTLWNSLGRQCCGGKVIPDTTACCGGLGNGQGQDHLPKPGFSCCGQEYVNASITLCCVSDTGESRVHYYGDENEKKTASDKCCGISRISSNLGCCNYLSYDTMTQVCADKSQETTGCGTGVVCPLSQGATAFCNRCDFDRTQQTCGAVNGGTASSLDSSSGPASTNQDPNAVCTTETEKIYSGLNISFVDTDLEPYSQYEYYVVSVNSAGSARSDFSTVQTPQAAPQLVHPPTATVAEGQLFVIYVSWILPGRPNGEITNYTLKRDGIELYRGLDLSFQDDLNILPYRSYSYQLSACNQAGCADSGLVSVATAQAPPEDLLSPLVQLVSPTSVKVMTQPPAQPNGIVTSYTVRLLGTERSFESKGPQEFPVDGLKPYSTYSFDSIVCTQAGCTTSPNTTVTTDQALPEGVAPLQVVVISSTMLNLYWQPPTEANGLITEYKVFRTGPPPVVEVYAGLGFSVSVDNLSPGASLTYQLQITNGAGTVESDPREIIMPQRTPLNIPPPQLVRVQSSTAIEIRWLPIVTDQGEIDQYRILMNVGQTTEVIRGVGLQTRLVVRELLPNTLYMIRLQACLRNVLNGCGTSSAVSATTREDVPGGLAPPTVRAVSPTAVQVSWMPPLLPNGQITMYRVYQRALNDPASEILINQLGGDELEFTHAGQDLRPYRQYEYQVEAINSVGSTKSNWTYVRTLQAAPRDLAAPTIPSTSTYGISVSWTSPQAPNGLINEYRIYYIHGSETEQFISVGGNDTTTFVSGLLAYTDYQVSVEARNGAGSVRSSAATANTQEGYPSGLPNFNVEKITSGTAVILTWDAPSRPNGQIIEYRIYQPSSSVAVYQGISRQFEFPRLSPFTEYTVSLEACTRAGCTRGEDQTFTTAETLPQDQPSPVLGSVNATHVTITWLPPVNPNGYVVSYEILRAEAVLGRRRRDTSFAITDLLGKGDFPVTRHTGNSQSFRGSDDDSSTSPLNRSTSSTSHAHINTNIRLGDEFDDDILFLHNGNVPITSIYRMLSPKQLNLNFANQYDTPGRYRRQAVTPPSNPVVVYQTTDTDAESHSWTDTNLSPYTQYMYAIRTSNSLGQVTSAWQVVRTEQSAPDNVNSPTLAHVANDINSILVTWEEPGQMNGILQGYQLQRNESVPFSFLADGERRFVDSGLIAFTRYAYTITACTGGGCTTSPPAVITTLEAPPLIVPPPTVSALDSTSIAVTWTPPQISNGEVIRYALNMDGTEVYTGLDEEFTVSGLMPFSLHTFTVTACSNGGCTTSGEVMGRSEDAPPEELSPPVLRVISANAIEIVWSPPAKPNGALESYDVRRDGRLIYTDSFVSTSRTGATQEMSYTDYSLEPGEEYSYTIIARNRKGSVESGEASAVTYSASPSGLTQPTLTPMSSTAIKVDWLPPASPNGVLVNYTIYQGSKAVYTGPREALSYTVPGLEPYTEYSFRMEACTARGCAVGQPATARTLPASPEGQGVPGLLPLADESGAHSGVRATWSPPAKPNGLVTEYELHRRVVLEGEGQDYSDSVLVYNGTLRGYTDAASADLRPFRIYLYMVSVFNAAGRADSAWATVTTREGEPEGVPAPEVQSTTSTTISVTTQIPSEPNGEIRLYRILVNGTVMSSSPAQQQTVGVNTPLQPYTVYEIQTEACTAGGCGISPAVETRTQTARPQGLRAIQVTGVTNDSAILTWVAPESPNGIIQRYEVYQRQACPLTDQPFEQTCVVGDATTIYSGLSNTFTAPELDSYAAYEFKLQAFNAEGGADFPEWVRAETMPSDPMYTAFPRLHKNGTLAMIEWGNSFTLNGRLREYILLADGKVVFRGVTAEHGEERQETNSLIEFIIQAITNEGQAESPIIIFDPNAVNNIGTTPTPPVTAEQSSGREFYEEIWFIVLMCLVALLILIVTIVICVIRSGPTTPYVRERMPLTKDGNQQQLQTPRGRAASLYGERERKPPPRDVYVIDAADGRVIHTNTLPEVSQVTHYSNPGRGVLNPAFSSDQVRATYLEDELEDDVDRDTFQWRGKPTDSGLFDDLDDSDSGQTFSYTKEQTIFTDTHL